MKYVTDVLNFNKTLKRYSDGLKSFSARCVNIQHELQKAQNMSILERTHMIFTKVFKWVLLGMKKSKPHYEIYVIREFHYANKMLRELQMVR